VYYLAEQQLSKQDHYDFGLRGMIALLRYAGRKRHEYPKLPDDEVWNTMRNVELMLFIASV
jgi:dynein heavy chain